jgi:MFS family permease
MALSPDRHSRRAVYAQVRESLASLPAPTGVRPRRRWLGQTVSRNVVFLGLTSLFTDISSEMVSTVLPLYLVFFLRFSPVQFGLIDGLYQGVSALVKLGGGVLADRTQRHKEVAGLGYAMSAVAKIGLLLGALGPGVLLASIVVDRTGKGIRTAPRDALISLSSPRAELGLAFAVHRALDTFGAMLGPLFAFALLTLVPNGFDVVFVASLCAAIVGLGVLGLFVQNRPPAEKPAEPVDSSKRVSLSPELIRQLLRSPGFGPLVLAATALGLATISDAFLYLTLQLRLTFVITLIPLLYVGTALAYLALAVPFGRLADRWGRGRVFLAGYLLLLGVYASVLLPDVGTLELIGCLVLLGAYYAATDGVLMALASGLLGTELRTTGLALLSGANGVARLAASLLFGGLWMWLGPEVSVGLFLAGLVVALGLAGLVLARRATPGAAHAG